MKIWESWTKNQALIFYSEYAYHNKNNTSCYNFTTHNFLRLYTPDLESNTFLNPHNSHVQIHTLLI